MSFLLGTNAVFAFIYIIDQLQQYTLIFSNHHLQKYADYNKVKLNNQEYSIYFRGVDYNMESYSLSSPHQSQHIVHRIIEQMVDQTTSIAEASRLSQLFSNQMPEGYLNYISNVSMLLHSHRNPLPTQPVIKIITEPKQQVSNQNHNPNPLRRIHKKNTNHYDQVSLTQNGNIRKLSICMSHRSHKSRASMEKGAPSRRVINSRRKIVENNRLVPLNRATEWQEGSGFDDKITQLRKRKIKLEQAMIAFREEERPDKLVERKVKENHIPFTTDFKGKIINFTSKNAKPKNNQNIPFIIKFETLVQSGRSWATWGKVNSVTRRNLFVRDANDHRGVSEVQLN